MLPVAVRDPLSAHPYQIISARAAPKKRLPMLAEPCRGKPGALPDRQLCRAWHIGRMPAVDTVLLPLCVGLALLGVIATGIAWRRGNKGRVIQGIGLALAPIALYFSGLLRLLWDAIVAFGTWASKIILSPAVWFGLSLLGLCIVLWVVGG